jgi:hypothetical protein
MNEFMFINSAARNVKVLSQKLAPDEGFWFYSGMPAAAGN